MTLSRHIAAAALLAASCAHPVFASGQAGPAGASAAPASSAAPDLPRAADMRGGPSGDAAQGQAPGDGDLRGERNERDERDERGGHGPRGGPDGGPHHGFGASGPGAPGPDAPPPHSIFGRLHRLDLSEAQQDKLFAITHAAAPKERDLDKAARKAHEALRTLGAAVPFDEARANAAARDLGQAIAGGALLRARLESQVLAVLTPAQREQLRTERGPGPRGRP
jgi:protein CpxP